VQEPAADETELVAENDRTEGAEGENDEEGESERRRRRRGRRGGRRRGRREDGVDPGFEEPRPAADTVEILPTPAVEEADPTLIEARTTWPVEVAAVAIETASLPALAGEAGEGSARQSPQFERGEELPSAEGDEGPSTTPPTAEAEQGVPYVSQAERELETASAAAEQGQPEEQPPHPVQTVTEKPANPRRGWWQRLIQP
jgi:ribonuclease E